MAENYLRERRVAILRRIEQTLREAFIQDKEVLLEKLIIEIMSFSGAIRRTAEDYISQLVGMRKAVLTTNDEGKKIIVYLDTETGLRKSKTDDLTAQEKKTLGL